MNPPACGHPLVKGDEGTEQKKGEQVMELSKLSLERLEGVDERLKAIVIECAARCSYPFNVSEGLRTKEQQREYVRQGKSRTMNSKHLTGKAVDLYPLTMNRKQVDWSRFEELADLMFQVARDQDTEIVWGGHWKTFVDKCHFELR
jgi:peptidoglycan L-alanyl-D-glutamate endopeptidase CwlK